MTDVIYLPIVSNDWRWNNQAPPPISGQIRTDSRDWSNATHHLYVNNLTDGGVDMSAQLAQIVPGTTLDLVMKTDPTRSVRYTATAAPVSQSETVDTLAVTYVDIAVTFVTFSGAIPNSGTLVTLSMTLPTPPVSGPITWKVAVVGGRPNRWVLTCSCAHGALTETNATISATTPVPPQAVIEATANNLIRRTGCTCKGLVAGMAEDADVEVAADVAGL